MIDVFAFAELPVAVLGLDDEGLATARALARSEAEVWAWDDDPVRRAAAGDAGIPIVDLGRCQWREVPSLIVSANVPFDGPAAHPVVAAARAAGVEVIGDVELLARSVRDAAYVGITGSQGKSTATALVGHIFKTSGRETEVGGALGVPVLSLDPVGLEGAYVLAMTPAMLRLTLSITFDVAVLLNVDPAPVAAGEMERYVTTLKQIFHRQTAPRTAVIGIDDDHGRAVLAEIAVGDGPNVIPISGHQRAAGGVYAVDGVLYDATAGEAVPVVDLKDLPALTGPHNAQNAAAAYAVATSSGIAPQVAMACIRSFPGLVHRQERVAVIDGVAYVNDARAASPRAAAAASSCYGTVYWITVARDGETVRAALVAHAPRVRHAWVLGGEAAASVGKAGDVISAATDVGQAVAAARARALADGAPGAVVLLSPMAAPGAPYGDFADLGDGFREAVRALPGEREEDEA